MSLAVRRGSSTHSIQIPAEKEIRWQPTPSVWPVLARNVSASLRGGMQKRVFVHLVKDYLNIIASTQPVKRAIG